MFKRGITLIELLIFMTVIGLLSSVILVSLNSERRKDRDAKRAADIEQIREGLKLYFLEHGKYPASLSLISPYVSQVPLDPLGGGYKYAPLENFSSYHLGANLEQGGLTKAGLRGSPILAADADFDSSLEGGFPGLSTDCLNSSSNDGCYDVRP
jgi:type II secretory pathway pseudopilin PulG